MMFVLTRSSRGLVISSCLFLALCGPAVLHGQAAADATKLVAPQEMEGLFPPSVYFQGKTAPVQMRNAAAIHFAGGGVFFAGLVDASGYASSVQEKYQMYLLAEQPMLLAGKSVPAGAYGAGFVAGRFLVMDLGGHTVAETETQVDETLARPRPLQIVLSPGGGARLYLGRRWIPVALAPAK